MKRILLMLAVLAGFAAGAQAENITVDTVKVMHGGTARLNIGVDVADASNTYYAFQMNIKLPDGFTMKKNSDGDPEMVYTDRVPSSFGNSTNYREDMGVYAVAGLHMSTAGIAAGTGPIFYLTVVAADTVKNGTYTGTISGIIFADKNDKAVSFDDATFSIVVSNNVTLDEESTDPLTAIDEQCNVTVKRTINANEWSTLVLPFAMSGDELTAAFGSTAKLAEFTEWESSEETDDDENPLSLSMVFKSKALSDGLEANHPVLIRLDHNVAQFTVAGKTISPESKPTLTVYRTNKSSGKKNRATFVGSYNPMTLDEETLFLSGNKFYYSVGKTKMDGFRAYFSVYDVVSEYYSATSSAKINLVVDGEVTGIGAVRQKADAPRGIYAIGGQYVGENAGALPAGVYIMDGRKVLVK